MLGSRAVLHSSKTNEWYTPSIYTDSAREVMGSIDLDPASCEAANELVQATQIYTIKTDGFNRDWHGNVWMNPPYGRGGQAKWTAKMIGEYKAGNIDQGVVLVNAATDTNWFQPLWNYTICFVRKRIKFVSLDGAAKHSPTHGNVLVYLGPPEGQERFSKEFRKYGPVVTSVEL